MEDFFASPWKEDLYCYLGCSMYWHIGLMMILAVLLGVGYACEPTMKWQMMIVHFLECTIVELWMAPFDGVT